MRMGEVKDGRLKAVYAWKAGRLIHENFGKGQNPLKDAAGFSLNLSLGTSKSYSRTESVTREYAGSKIAAGEKADLTATECDLAMQGSTVEGKNVALAAKGDVRLEAGENSSITTNENKTSAASIGVSFSPQGLSGLSLHANEAQGNSKENASTYTPTEIAAKDALQIESGKDTNILGSTVQGNKVTAKIGGNLNIETLQEKETYEEKNTSAGFDLSWDINLGKFSKPTFGLSAGRGTIDSHYRSARGQAGIFADKGGFDIYVEKNTDLKGAVIASEADAGKNRLSTGTFSFSDLENGADYSAKSIGAEYHHYGSYDKMSRQEKNKVYNTIGLSPSLSMPAKGDANSTTTSAVAPGTIDIRKNPAQDISALSRDTANSLNELGRIFDKQKIEEQQELAKTFGEEAFRLAHNLPDDGSGRKIAVHAIIGGIMSQITGTGFASGAIGAGVNEAVIGEIKKIQDPSTAQIVSAIVGAAAAKAVGGNAGSGATSAASGTKNNLYEKIPEIRKQLEEQLITEEYESLRENEYMPLYGEKDGRKVAVTIDRDGNIHDLDIESDNGNNTKRIHLPHPLSEYNTPFEVEIYADYTWREDPVEKTGLVNTYKRGEYDGHLFDALYPKKSLSSKIQRNFFDWAAETVSAVDDNMSFGLAQNFYHYVTGHRIDNLDSPFFYGGRLTGTHLTLLGSLWEIPTGTTLTAGGLMLAPETGGTSTVSTTGGIALAIHGISTVKNSFDNGIDDSRSFIKSLGKGGISHEKKFTREEAIEHLNKGAIDDTKSHGRTRSLNKSGGYQQALEDFYELHLDDIKKIDTDFGEGVTGILQDGTHVVVRAGSKSGGPTLEIQSLGGKIYKYRY